MTMKVPRIEVGMASRMLTVVDQDPRNSQQTKPGQEGGQDAA